MLKKTINFVLLVSLVLLVERGYCLDLDKLKVYFLKGDYKSAIAEGEKILANHGSPDSAQLYYILGLSYLKDGNYLRASDIFEIILKELKGADFKERAFLGLGDAYFLRGDFVRAEGYYKELLTANPHTEFKAQAYYRLSQISFKKGDTESGRQYLARLKKEFPSNSETLSNMDLCLLTDSPSDFYYSIQVGSFSNITNARNLTQRLAGKNYPAYIEEVNFQGKASYRVKIGKLRQREDAQDLEKKLIEEGYPTKICP